MAKRTSKALFIAFVLACAGFMHANATDCTTDALCNTATAGTVCNSDGAAGNIICLACDATTFGSAGTTSGVSNCATCTYESTSGGAAFECTGCEAGYAASAGTVAKPTACAACDDSDETGYVDYCATCTSVIAGGSATFTCTACETGYFAYTVATGTSNPTKCAWVGRVDFGGDYACGAAPTTNVAAGATVGCTQGYSSTQTAGQTTYIDSYTEVGWYAAGGETYPCNKDVAGCESCLNNAAPTAATCVSAFDGWAKAAGAAPIECQDAFCSACTSGEQTSDCDTYYLSSSTGTALDGANVILAGQVSSYTSDISITLTIVTLTCSSGAFKSSITDEWCRPCDDSSFGIEGAATCETDETTKTVQALTCKSGYKSTTITGTSYVTCTKCGDNIDTCTLTDAGALATIVSCATGYAQVGTTLVCKAFPTGASAATYDDSAVVLTITCGSGYAVQGSDKVCKAFSTGANAGSWNTGGTEFTATGCIDGYWLDTSLTPDACVACTQNNVETCSSASVVTTCKQGFYKSAANACTADSDLVGCDVPEVDTFVLKGCDTCSEGYRWNYNTRFCTACKDTNAVECEALTSTKDFSTNCKDGYYNKAGTCTAYPQGCDGIYEPSLYRTKVGCTSCEDGYYLDKSTDQCTKCGTGIATCSVADSAIWPETCSSGYTWSAGSISISSTAGLPATVTFPKCVADPTEEDTTTGAATLAVSSIAVLFALLLTLF